VAVRRIDARAPWQATHVELRRLTSFARKRYLEATHRHANLEIGEGVDVGPGFRLWMPDNGTLVIGRGTELRHHVYIEIYGDGEVHIGAECHLTYYTHIACSSTISIGDRAGIGLSTLVVDGGHTFQDVTTAWIEQPYKLRPITIGDDAAIHSNCTIINDVGHHSVIGANSVVTRPIPPYCIAVGAPARIIEYFGPPDERSPDVPPDVPDTWGLTS
jgi:acetyltransferase-like isoleucine patch superfamily enzyme